ncbi:hypothetical protein GSN00_13935 [Cylindrospermopsis raciborskii CHAB3438]|uniref:hypothetical protein n=1 Tax=Cylindrospermopsis raciborskii TaxID=77022 RepID=UPI001F111E58|nr:hypothetical protein [Cylindrospermopsis raciborskii]MCH4905443.1 hypothetical protein [Cylindrospermopsis raciborskii CHAB3438]
MSTKTSAASSTKQVAPAPTITPKTTFIKFPLLTPIINQALSIVYTQLSDFSESSNYYQILSTAFGNNYNRKIAEKLKLYWQQVNFTQIPQIEILDGGILGSAYGAYARETNKIYLSKNFVKNNTAEVIGQVILEEVGHFIDSQLTAIFM